MSGAKKNLEEQISSTLYDLTHLEINTIIKEEMSGTKAPSSPRLLLHSLATKFHHKLMRLGEKYSPFLDPPENRAENLFRGKQEYMGSAYYSFHELSERSAKAVELLKTGKSKGQVTKGNIASDVMMLQRIVTISDDIRRILKIDGVDPAKNDPAHDFDKIETMNDFRTLSSHEADKYELNLDLRQLMVIKKANDIGTERVVLQTVIGMDGDVTTRIAKAFADKPVTFINEMHNQAIGLSVDFWKTLVNVVVQLGKQIFDVIKS